MESFLYIFLSFVSGAIIVYFILKGTIAKNNGNGVNELRSELNTNLKSNREELSTTIISFSNSISQRVTELTSLQKSQLDSFAGRIDELSRTNNDKLEKINSTNQSFFKEVQEKITADSHANRTEQKTSLESFESAFKSNIKLFDENQQSKFSELQKYQRDMVSSIDVKLENIRTAVEEKLSKIQDDNNSKLEKMRQTVDEKLHDTLEKRLGESFRLVQDRLEQVSKGLGEMQSLATGVGDIKKVLSNIKSRGVLGEYQLENILDDLLTREQFSKNVKTNPASSSMVEFAVKLPGRHEKDGYVWLPIDSKFPTENYQMLLKAYEDNDINSIAVCKKALVKKIKDCAKEIKDKYICPPYTTDFAILFLPFEGLYAEVLNNPGMFESLQREFKITLTGPTTLSAVLNSLQMGFRTLAIEKRSSEVWEILGAVKTEFGNFADILAKTKKKLENAAFEIENAERKSRNIERKLKDVQALPAAEVKLLEGSENLTLIEGGSKNESLFIEDED